MLICLNGRGEGGGRKGADVSCGGGAFEALNLCFKKALKRIIKCLVLEAAK